MSFNNGVTFIQHFNLQVVTFLIILILGHIGIFTRMDYYSLMFLMLGSQWKAVDSSFFLRDLTEE